LVHLSSHICQGFFNCGTLIQISILVWSSYNCDTLIQISILVWLSYNSQCS
jgi:hypothetical protein